MIRMSRQKKKCMNNKGYISIYKPDHPHARGNGYVFEHRIIVERSIGRYLTPNEKVHHINGMKDDNNISNLKVFDSISQHRIFHLKQNGVLSNGD